MNKKELLFLSVGIFLTVVAWLIADVYHAANRVTTRTKIEVPTFPKYEISGDVLKVLLEKKE
jgi:hypothetical protein